MRVGPQELNDDSMLSSLTFLIEWFAFARFQVVVLHGTHRRVYNWGQNEIKRSISSTGKNSTRNPVHLLIQCLPHYAVMLIWISGAVLIQPTKRLLQVMKTTKDVWLPFCQ